MAYRFVQFDEATGRKLGSTDTVVRTEDGAIESPPGRIIIDAEARPEAATAIAYDPQTDTFAPAPAPRRLLTKADVIAALTPEQWAELNRYHPTAADEPYRNPEVYWGMSVFLAATRPFTLDDARVTTVFQALVVGGAMTSREVQTLRERLADGGA